MVWSKTRPPISHHINHHHTISRTPWVPLFSAQGALLVPSRCSARSTSDPRMESGRDGCPSKPGWNFWPMSPTQKRFIQAGPPKIQKYLLQSRSAMICMVNLVNGCKWLFSHPMLILYCKLPSIRPSHFAVDRLWKGIVVPFAHLVSPFEEHDWHGRIQELSCSQNCLLIVRFQEWMSFISV